MTEWAWTGNEYGHDWDILFETVRRSEAEAKLAAALKSQIQAARDCDAAYKRIASLEAEVKRLYAACDNCEVQHVRRQ